MTPSGSQHHPTVSWHDGAIVLGTVYNVFHTEYTSDAEFFARVDDDLAAIHAAHIRFLLIFPMSEWDAESRTLRWTRTDYLVRKLEQLGMKFVPLLLKEEQCGHYFPNWKFAELDEIRRQHEVAGPNRNNREHVDFLHPQVWPVLEAHFRQVIERYGNSSSLAFYNIWNEPHYSHQSPHVVDRFRDWLRQKYGTLADLRRAWGDDFSSWSEVTPFLADDWDSSLPSIDWVLFRNELNGTILGELRTMLHRYDRTHAINANPVGTTWSNFGDFGGYNTDNWQFTPHEDFAGLSYYPDAIERPHQDQPFPLWLHNLTFTTARAAAAPKPFILTELFTNGKSGLTVGGWLDKASVWQLAWTALANDCKGIFYWKWQPFARGRQSLGRGLTRMDGTLAPRGEAVREFGSVLSEWGAALHEARLEPPRVAVLLDMVGLVKCLEQHPQRGLRHFLYESNAGLFRVLDRSNHTVDFLRADRPLDPSTLSTYDVVILPFQIVMRRSIAAMLRDYVAAGGGLIADCMCASMDELDFAFRVQPGAGLDEIFGARRKDWVAEAGTHTIEWIGTEGRQSCEVAVYREVLEPAPEAEVLATFRDTGTPAVVKHVFGQGRTLLLGCSLGGTFYRNEGSALETLFHGALDEMIRHRSFSWIGSRGTPMIRRHIRGADSILYLINPTPEPLEGELILPGAGPVKVRSLLEPATFSFDRPDAAHPRVKIALPPAGVQVLYVSAD
jgi:beta-galactosidase GanA